MNLPTNRFSTMAGTFSNIRQTLRAMMLTLVIVLAVIPAKAFYNPSTGKWLSRDPINESGGANETAFVENQPPRFFDAYGLVGEPAAPNCAPCQYEGWVHRMKADASADAWGHMEGNEDVSPGIDWSSGRPCCACGKSGMQYRTIDPKCRVKIWIDSSKQPEDPVPNQNTAGIASSIWDHESQHAAHFAESIRNRDNLYKLLGTICVPDKCRSPLRRALVRADHAYRSLRSYKDAHINCRDASVHCPEATFYRRQACSLFNSAANALIEYVTCMRSECGSFDAPAAIVGFSTCP
jgi:hypothetical protein